MEGHNYARELGDFDVPTDRQFDGFRLWMILDLVSDVVFGWYSLKIL